MRTILVLAVVLAAAFGLMSSRGAEPVEPPAAVPVPQPTYSTSPAGAPTTPPAGPPAAPPPIATWPAPPTYTAPSDGYQEHVYNHDELQRLRPYFINLAEQRAERMTVAELKQGIAEMRRQCLIAELAEFANGSPDDFDSMRAEISVMVLTAKDRKDLVSTIRTVAKELEETKTKTE